MSSELYQVANYGLAGHYYSHYDQVKQQGYDQQLIQVEGVDIVNIVTIINNIIGTNTSLMGLVWVCLQGSSWLPVS